MEVYNFALKLLGWLAFVVVVAVIIDLWAQHNDPDQIDEEPR